MLISLSCPSGGFTSHLPCEKIPTTQPQECVTMAIRGWHSMMCGKRHLSLLILLIFLILFRWRIPRPLYVAASALVGAARICVQQVVVHLHTSSMSPGCLSLLCPFDLCLVWSTALSRSLAAARSASAHLLSPRGEQLAIHCVVIIIILATFIPSIVLQCIREPAPRHTSLVDLWSTHHHVHDQNSIEHQVTDLLSHPCWNSRAPMYSYA